MAPEVEGMEIVFELGFTTHRRLQPLRRGQAGRMALLP